MKLKKEAWFIVNTILIVLGLLIIFKFFICDEFIEPKEREKIPQPEIVQKNIIDNVIDDEVNEIDV